MRRARGSGDCRIVTTTVATSRIEASAATRRWLYSINTSAENRGMTWPWQSGQSGHARPEPVALTTLPMLISTNTEASPAQARARGLVISPAMPDLGDRQGDVVASVGLPPEEHDRDGDQEDEPTGNPHDDPTQVLVSLRRQHAPHARCGRVVRVQHVVRHRDEDGDHH